MKYNVGDVVIKTTGGNKMTVYEKLPGGVYKCLWFVESSQCEDLFNEDEIVNLNEWKRLLKTEEREDKINQILK